MSLQLCKVVEFDHFRSGDVRRVQQAAFSALSNWVDVILLFPQFPDGWFWAMGKKAENKMMVEKVRRL